MSVTDLDAGVRDAATGLLLALADDDFVAGHRLTEWVAVGPTLEEDNALSSIAQDELGHARLWYEYVADALGRPVDDLALNRHPDERRNSVLVEAAHGDFADTVAVNFLYDEAEALLLGALRDGSADEVAARAEKALAEEPFHRQHAEEWLERLPATAEGRQRIERAFDDALRRSADLFAFDPGTVDPLVDAGVLARPIDDVAATWRETVRTRLADLPLSVPAAALDAMDAPPARNGRAGEHTDDLTAMLDHLHPDNVVGDHPVNRYEP